MDEELDESEIYNIKFENTVNPFQIYRELNEGLCIEGEDGCTKLEHLTYKPESNNR